MNTRILAVLGGIVLVAFLYLSYRATNQPVQTVFPEVMKVASSAATMGTITDHTKGAGKHILTEFADLQCPGCRLYYQYLTQQTKNDPAFAKVLAEQYTFVYHQFPLSFHAHAQAAAQSAEAAGLQGKFFEFIDLAYAKQAEWESSDKAESLFEAYAKDLGLDIEQFKRDAQSDAVRQKIIRDMQLGEKAQIPGTPTFFIDGERIDSNSFQSMDDFKKLLIEKSRE